MSKRRIYDDELHAQFVTFSCYKRRRLLDHDRAKKIVLGTLESERKRHDAHCAGFVVMPNHVHAIVWFPVPNQLGHFMMQWKQRSSFGIAQFVQGHLTGYAHTVAPDDAIWQRKYYAFNIYSDDKLRQKLEYMHLNPVRGGLVQDALQWPWSSARWYEENRSVGVAVEWPG